MKIPFPLWFLRTTWVAMPFMAGAAATEAAADWTQAPRLVAEILLWAAWTVGLVAVFAPRPLGLTALRTIAPLLAVLAVLAAADASVVAAVAALVPTVLAAIIVASPSTALACAAGVAYGTEVRHPLKVPPALLVAPLPIAVALVGAGVAAGPLLLATGEVVLGTVAAVGGFAIAGLLSRSLHTLSRRWAILVPAGLVIVDGMTLADPVLFARDQILMLGPVDRSRAPSAAEVDLRLGATVSSLEVGSRGDVHVARALASRRGARVVGTRRVLFAPVRPGELLRIAGERGIPIQTATALPTTTSPS